MGWVQELRWSLSNLFGKISTRSREKEQREAERLYLLRKERREQEKQLRQIKEEINRMMEKKKKLKRKRSQRKKKEEEEEREWWRKRMEFQTLRALGGVKEKIQEKESDLGNIQKNKVDVERKHVLLNQIQRQREKDKERIGRLDKQNLYAEMEMEQHELERREEEQQAETKGRGGFKMQRIAQDLEELEEQFQREVQERLIENQIKLKQMKEKEIWLMKELREEIMNVEKIDEFIRGRREKEDVVEREKKWIAKKERKKNKF